MMSKYNKYRVPEKYQTKSNRERERERKEDLQEKVEVMRIVMPSALARALAANVPLLGCHRAQNWEQQIKVKVGGLSQHNLNQTRAIPISS